METSQLSLVFVSQLAPTYNSCFRRTETISTYRVSHNLNGFSSLLSAHIAVDNMFEQLFLEQTVSANPTDLHSCYIDSQNLGTPIWIASHPVGLHRSQDFLNSIFKVCQSNSTFLLDGLLTVTFSLTRDMRGAGRTLRAPITAPERSKNKRAVVCINNSDDNCLMRALVVVLFLSIKGKNTNTGNTFSDQINLTKRGVVPNWQIPWEYHMMNPWSSHTFH